MAQLPSSRRLRRQDPKLPPDCEGLQLHGAALSSACRDPEWVLDLSGVAAGELKLPLSAIGQKLTLARPFAYERTRCVVRAIDNAIRPLWVMSIDTSTMSLPYRWAR